MKKIAFCFLCYDTLSHNDLWVNFLKDHENEYNVYTHPKKITSKTPDWIRKNSVKIHTTEWCSFTQVSAIIRMVKKALKNKDNKYFSVNSGACIPLFNFEKVKEKIFSKPQARIYFPGKNKKAFEGKDKHPHYANFILNRKTAKDFVRLGNKSDKEAQKLKKEIFNEFKYHRDNNTWYSWCEDELVMGEWFIHLYGNPKSKTFQKNIINQKSTYAEFKPNAPHPIIFSKYLLKKDNDKKLKQIKSVSIFGRKFTNDGAMYVCTKSRHPSC